MDIQLNDTVFRRAMQLLGEDTTTFGAGGNPDDPAPLRFHLMREPWETSGDMTIGVDTEANFDGYAAFDGPSVSFNNAVDPLTGDNLLPFLIPIYGLAWETASLLNLPQTITGWSVTLGDDTTVLAGGMLEQPITLNGVNQSIVVNQPVLRQPYGSYS